MEHWLLCSKMILLSTNLCIRAQTGKPRTAVTQKRKIRREEKKQPAKEKEIKIKAE